MGKNFFREIASDFDFYFEDEYIKENVVILGSHNRNFNADLLENPDEWQTMQVCGYVQGDWCDVYYKCSEKVAREAGKLWLGCGKEFCLNDDVCGFVVPDDDYASDDELKEILCDMEGLNPDETDVILYDGYHMVTDYKVI